MSLVVPAACESQLGGRAEAARLAILIDLIAALVGVNVSPSAASGTDGAGTRFSSADASGADAAITGVPTVGSALVADSVQVSVGATAQTINFKEETSGTVIAGPFYQAANSTFTYVLNKTLPTINKKLMIRTSAAGNVSALANYHSNP